VPCCLHCHHKCSLHVQNRHFEPGRRHPFCSIAVLLLHGICMRAKQCAKVQLYISTRAVAPNAPWWIRVLALVACKIMLATIGDGLVNMLRTGQSPSFITSNTGCCRASCVVACFCVSSAASASEWEIPTHRTSRCISCLPPMYITLSGEAEPKQQAVNWRGYSCQCTAGPRQPAVHWQGHMFWVG